MRVLPSWKKLLIATFVVILLFTMFNMVNLFSNKPYNVVNAMIEAYEKLGTLAGTIEYVSEDIGTNRRYEEIIEFKFAKPNKFQTIHKTSENTVLTKIFDGGEVMYSTYSATPNRVRIDYMDDPHMLKTQLQWLLLDNFSEEIKNHKDAIAPTKIANELIAGRQAEGYEISFSYNGNTTIHRIWVDRQLNLPLKWELIYPGFTTEEGKVIPGHKITTSFLNLEVNPQLDNTVFIYDKKPDIEYYINTPPMSKPQK